MARELVEHDDEGEPAERCLRPRVERAFACLLVQRGEARAHQWVERAAGAEPVIGGQLAKPEIEDAALVACGERLEAGFGIIHDKAPIHSAASSSSAAVRSTLTSRETPFSTMVTPNRRCMRLIVTALWVTIR